MDKFIYNAFQNLPETAVPQSLHASIVRATLFRRVFKYITVLTIVVAFTFVVSIFHLHTRMLETESLLTIKAVIGTLDFSLDSIFDSLGTLFEFLPVQAIILSFLNFVALVFMILLMSSFMRLKGKFAV